MRTPLLALLALLLLAVPAAASPEDNLFGVSRFAGTGNIDYVYQNTSAVNRTVNIVAIDHEHQYIYLSFFLSPDGVNFYNVSRQDGAIFASVNLTVPPGYYYGVTQGCYGVSPCIVSGVRGIEVWREW